MFISQSQTLNNFYLALFVNLLIYILILMAAPIVIQGFLSLFKGKVTNIKTIYLYAFSTGMFLIIGTVGFLGEGFNTADQFVHSVSYKGETIAHTWRGYIIQALLVGGGALIGLTFVILGRFIFVKASKTDFHSNHSEHNHSEHLISLKEFDNPKAAWMAIIMLMSHRIVDGLFLGYAVFILQTSPQNAKQMLPLILTFNIHFLVEIIIVYYRQIQYGQKKSKAILYNFLTFLLIIPFMFIGAYSGSLLLKNKWLIALIFSLGGAIMLFMGVFELIPEFIHVRNQSPRILYTTFIIFALAIVFTLILLCFHSHINTA
ncbi:hypothetical protein FJO69_02680 [[Mycoplasma] falconis]|uniref:Metal transporter n=1 Tax=[Mycoplasma] falconis TaxID=92403 RepID=A0A501X8Y9_9BACT|nr:ZIP family metal transporter [[Mycoplasma] falconis]TPE56926.1 hypothetical protein FJO69_02680 [[Mycoplasma] falconis]